MEPSGDDLTLGRSERESFTDTFGRHSNPLPLALADSHRSIDPFHDEADPLAINLAVSDISLGTPSREDDRVIVDDLLSRKILCFTRESEKKSLLFQGSESRILGTQDEGSFFTARGTVRSVIDGEEMESEVIVAWMGAIGTLRFAKVDLSFT
jgi:hypothetical protein